MRAGSVLETRLWIAAAVALCAVLALGAYVAFRPPTPIDVSGIALRGHAVPAAYFFTLLGRWPVLLSLGVLAIGIGMTLRGDLRAVLLLLGTQVASQAGNSLVKLAFRRERPGHFVGVKDVEFSYPSGHAVTSIVFFLGFAILAWHAPFPRPVSFAIAALLGVCMLGIPWSRLALGAHYVTDVVGGVLFGTAWLCALLAVLIRTRTQIVP